MKRLIVMLAALALPAAALAQDRATQFVAVSGPTREHVPGGALLVGAYALVWLLLFGLVLRTAMVQSRAAKDLARLELLLQKKTEPAAEAKAQPAETKAQPAKEATEEKSA